MIICDTNPIVGLTHFENSIRSEVSIDYFISYHIVIKIKVSYHYYESSLNAGIANETHKIYVRPIIPKTNTWRKNLVEELVSAT